MIEHCKNFRRVTPLCDWIINISPKCYYLIEVENGKDLGVWGFHPHEDGLMVHVNLSPDCRGKNAKISAKNAFDWIFKNTDSIIIYANIPESFKHVQRLACDIGFKFFSVNDLNDRCYSYG